MPLKSKKTPRTSNDGLAPSAKKHWVIEISWLTQESFGLKPDLIPLRRLFSIINSKIASKTSFFKHFGTYRQQLYRAIVIDNLVIVFTMYWNNVSFFQSSVKVPNFKQLQNIMRNGFMIDGQLSIDQ